MSDNDGAYANTVRQVKPVAPRKKGGAAKQRGGVKRGIASVPHLRLCPPPSNSKTIHALESVLADG